MSTYFDGSQLRAIDSDAAADGEPMSAALEAQLANDHHYLHRVGGGSVVKLGTPVGTGQTDDHCAVVGGLRLSSLHYQPFLVTRGLSEVRIDWHGRIDDYDLPVRLELTGFGSSMRSGRRPAATRRTAPSRSPSRPPPSTSSTPTLSSGRSAGLETW
jgi:hypothetical protein